MTLHVALTHRTSYSYDRLTALGPQVVRLRPAPHSRTPILSYSLDITPKTHFINWQQDPFGNYLARLVFPEKTDTFEVVVDLVADMAVINPFNFFIEEKARDWPFEYGAALKEELTPYLKADAPGPLLDDYLAGLRLNQTTTIDYVVELNRQLQSDIGYLIRMEPGVQTPEETLKNRSGSCRDSGWLLVQILRHKGLAARFVSGYLIQLKPDVKSLDGPSGAEVDFTDLHAWAEVYLPGAGWIGLDPTSGLLTGEGHIPLAATPRPQSAAPISGAHEKAEVTFSFDMKVTRIAESPRVTKPYTDDQWAAINATGKAVDARLQAGDVRLSMGGEPTFVSIDDMDGAEWNTAAVGPTKRQFAENLIRRLRDKFAPGGLLHYGQGKWYPGEQLPRWAFACYWRTDGEPLWHDASLIDREKPARRMGVADAGNFAQALCDQLGLPADSAIPAYEDAAHFALIEQKLPVNLDPADNKLADEAERARVIKVFDQGVESVTGYVLPIQVWQSRARGRRWVTEKWAFRRAKLFLAPGDSPIGFRLPLGSLPYIAPINFPHVYPRDPLAQTQPLPPRDALLADRRAVTLEPPVTAPLFPNEVFGSVRTAMAIEPRDGHLCVFTPPLEDAEDYAALVAAVENAAAQSATRVHIEGYSPPFDPRLNVIKVTPDPGVIEVNIQPAANWDHAVNITETLYEEARLARLGTEKFMIDGRHTGTGGGNHIVMGGMTPADSPFLRRPDLLGSVIAFWQNHPSLSYLFSGMFIGPTSQAPRIDEARHDQLYEMEIALAQIPERGQGWTPSWLVDRIFRNLLIDVTGNTHRAEICIDKLYSPDGPTGRLGLVEFRSFEMPPHAQMSLAQQLLLRALIAWFWETPYRRKLIPWGTSLHDKFMLPAFVWADFRDVLAELRGAGFDLKDDWFAPHFEFRFPVIGHIEREGVTLELRQALEPWHVMGEEGVIGGTARYVDSSLERVQARVAGDATARFTVTCNGRALPLQSTGVRGEQAAGVRFRAWQPPSCLHPTIAPHVPLVFDIVDKWSGRSIGGCRYHVAHPGGKAYETFPINALEAESRRAALFEAIGHTSGAMRPGAPRVNPDFPHTLDLRRA
ncbi:MAG: transglutaminase family protein [Hyphomicrobiales bacterium]|nr:transglutaminase family protein [Hyphomicrobiales bacterium]